MLALQPHPPRLLSQVRRMPMSHILKATAYVPLTTPRLQACGKRVLEDLQVCATLHHTRTSQAHPMNLARSRIRDEDSRGILMVESRLGILSRRCIRIQATTLKQRSSEQVRATGKEHLHQKKHHTHHLLSGLRMSLQTRHQSKALLPLVTYQIVSKVGARRASA